ncbi:hypothetical protein BDM02DRAFT_2327547 [Thelephora ganbajun]|uniref:Uncharacterized protein n=1 Tax=Thelephora ganbajun TaxID=370292 RepID=A0ACB6YY48_THEGA|nr:hypothetical protein BDM02DRAFT_2327547 [Thelephora ganbajun]
MFSKYLPASGPNGAGSTGTDFADPGNGTGNDGGSCNSSSKAALVVPHQENIESAPMNLGARRSSQNHNISPVFFCPGLFLRTCIIECMIKKVPTRTLRSSSTGGDVLWRHVDALLRFVYLCRIAPDFVEVSFWMRGCFTEANRRHAVAQNLAVYSPDYLRVHHFGFPPATRTKMKHLFGKKPRKSPKPSPERTPLGIPANTAAGPLGFPPTHAVRPFNSRPYNVGLHLSLFPVGLME